MQCPKYDTKWNSYVQINSFFFKLSECSQNFNRQLIHGSGFEGLKKISSFMLMLLLYRYSLPLMLNIALNFGYNVRFTVWPTKVKMLTMIMI